MLGIKGMSVLPLFLVQWSVLDHIFTLFIHMDPLILFLLPQWVLDLLLQCLSLNRGTKKRLTFSVEVAPAALLVPEGKSVKNGKRNAEDEIEKVVSAKKQKLPEKVVPVKKQPPPKKVESSSSEEDSSDSEVEAKVQPKKVIQPKKGTQPAKQESSDDSSSESSSDDASIIHLLLGLSFY
ncbi:hypothetical protein BDA96_10G006300 [Sorghum bicolor]|uniref:Uncharacterized protein n=1 Tax=Sorghum bicolor TaxID=4558 RepID=A0A921PXW5_SORBI|nr:hypothetical protein BDA96_10G006300 [Sorghum bicolor]